MATGIFETRLKNLLGPLVASRVSDYQDEVDGRKLQFTLRLPNQSVIGSDLIRSLVQLFGTPVYDQVLWVDTAYADEGEYGVMVTLKFYMVQFTLPEL